MDIAQPVPPAPAPAPAPPAGTGDSLISFDDDQVTPSQAPSVNAMTSQMQAMNVGPSPTDQDDEFDMFAQSRKSTFDESRKGGSSYTDNLQPFDRTIASTMSIEKTEPNKTEERSPMDDIESWLNVTETDVANAEAAAA